jgi:hypothetical protein
MIDFLLKILSDILAALNEIFAAFNYDKKQGKRTERPATVTQPPAPSPTTPTQTEKPPVNVLVPVEMQIGSADLPVYKMNKSVLTFRERILHSALRKALGNEYAILMKVRMGDFIYLSNEPQDRKSFVNQVICKHVDFLLCGKLRLQPLLVIELDDSSHNAPDRIERDRIKNDILDAVGLPYLRIELQKTYDPAQLQTQIKAIILPESPLFTPDEIPNP